jgi:hypothetical protein
VGPDAGVLHSDGTGWATSTAARGPLTGVYGTGPTDVWAVGPQDALHFDGTSWSDRGLTGLDAGLVTVWEAAPDIVWAADEYSSLYRWQPDAGWRFQYQMGNNDQSLPILRATITGSGPNDIYACSGAQAVHFDGGTWSVLTAATLGSSNLNFPTRLWSIGPNRVITDDWREIYEGDGVAPWQLVAPATFSGLASVAMGGSGPDDVWILGLNAQAWHWDGATWSGTQLPASSLWALAAVDAHNVYVVGENGQVLHLKH